MADALTTLLEMTKPEVGGSDNSWGNKLNAALDILDKVYRDAGGALTTSGTANVQILTPLHTGYASLKDGLNLIVRAGVGNTGALTLDFNDFGAKPVRKMVASVATALVEGDWPLDHLLPIAYNETLVAGGVWILLTPPLSVATNAQALTGTSTQLALSPDDLAYVDINRRPRTFNQLCPHSNLVVKYATAATCTIVADAVVLFDTNGKQKRFGGGISETLTMSASTGAGLRDTGAEASSTWYSIYLIGKEDGTLAALCSVADGGKGPAGGSPAATPTLPATYTYWGYVGSVYNNSSSNFVQFHQNGNIVTCAAQDITITLPNTNYTSTSLAALVPPEALSVSLHTDIRDNLSGNGVFYMAPVGSGTSSAIGEHYFSCDGGAAIINAQVTIPLITAQIVYFRRDNAFISYGVKVTGYTL